MALKIVKVLGLTSTHGSDGLVDGFALGLIAFLEDGAGQIGRVLTR